MNLNELKSKIKDFETKADLIIQFGHSEWR